MTPSAPASNRTQYRVAIRLAFPRSSMPLGRDEFELVSCALSKNGMSRV